MTAPALTPEELAELRMLLRLFRLARAAGDVDAQKPATVKRDRTPTADAFARAERVRRRKGLTG